VGFKGNASSPGDNRSSSATSDLEEIVTAGAGATATSVGTLRSVGLPRISLVATVAGPAGAFPAVVTVQFRQRQTWQSLPAVVVAAAGTVFDNWEVSSKELRFQVTAAAGGPAAATVNLSAMQ